MSAAAPPLETWLSLSQSSDTTHALASELALPEPIARILACRGFGTPAAARAFLAPDITQLHSPLLMLGMSTAVKRLRAALLAAEPILIYGDYDVDGTVATVLLKTALERAADSLGVTPDVRYHIPHRLREGYGIQTTRLADAAAEGVRLVVSVDTGIRAFAAAEEAAALGLDLIVTDHHLPDAVQGVPTALAVLNPHQPGCPYPFKELCGAAVSFKLAQALLEATARDSVRDTPDAELTRLREKTLPSFLKLLAIATIADAVPLTGENRVIAALGLRELRKPSRSGLRALMDLARIDTTRPISAGDVGFRIAPRINAAGRMDIAADVVEMFLSRDPALARSLAEKLHRLNEERRATEGEALRAIEAHIDSLAAGPAGLPAALVLDDSGLHDASASDANASHAPSSGPEPSRSEGEPDSPAPWHRGVLGILASRVVDRTGRPALVLSHDPTDNIAHGSGRSVAGFHLLDALTAAHTSTPDPLFTRFGGHAHAVGFALPSAHVPELRRRLAALAAAANLDPAAATVPTCDAELRLAEITPAFLNALQRLGPFGNGNPEPVFLARNVRLAAALRVIKERHLRLVLEDGDDGARHPAMAWSRGRNGTADFAALAREHNWAEGSAVDVVFRMHLNTHPDFGGWEIEVLHLRSHLPPC